LGVRLARLTFRRVAGHVYKGAFLAATGARFGRLVGLQDIAAQRAFPPVLESCAGQSLAQAEHVRLFFPNDNLDSFAVGLAHHVAQVVKEQQRVFFKADRACTIVCGSGSKSSQHFTA
jgi:hypothetical protein